MKPYAVAISARIEGLFPGQTTVRTTVVALFANNEEEAEGTGLGYARQHFLPSDGWSSHLAIPLQLSAEWIARAAAEYGSEPTA